jgi:hypothetical protein
LPRPSRGKQLMSSRVFHWLQYNGGKFSTS